MAADSRGHFTEAGLANYRTVVFLNTSGDVLSANEQDAFEDYFKQGGGFLAVGSAIAGDTDWAFGTKLLGTRAQGTRSVQEAATIKVADRVHDASRSLPERFVLEDSFYNTTSDVRGQQHVLATVDEGTYDENDGTAVADDHPVMWCQDLEGGRAFYTATGHNAATFANAEMREHLAGAINWAAGRSDMTYSDCGATVLANYKQIKISAPPNLNEPIGFDQLPDGRIIQTARAGQVRLHDPEGGTTTTLANLSDTAEFPDGLYTQSEDGLYGPAVDRNFAQNKWVYLYYSPATVTNVRQSDGSIAASITTPLTNAPTTAASLSAWDPYVGYFQLSRFKFVDAAPGEPAHLDLGTEQQIMRVPVNRGACCHVGGDIDFDEDNNLWFVTGDDTPAGGGNSGGFGPFNDMKTNETQAIRVFNADGGTFTLTFAGQTTGALPFNATAAQVQTALEALANIAPGDVVVTGGPANTGNLSVSFRQAYAVTNVPELTADSAALTFAAPSAPTATTTPGTATVNEVQTVRTTDATGGTFTITFDGQTTAPLPWNATAAQVQAALEALSNIAPGDVTVAGGPANTANVTVTFTGALGARNVAQMTTDAGGLTWPAGAPAAAPAATTTAGSTGVNEVQTVRTTNATGGTFTITFDGQTTAPLPWNATAAQVQAALEALSNIAPGDVTVAGGPANTANMTVTFTGALAATNVAQMTTNAAGLTFTAAAPAATTTPATATANEVQTVRTTNATGGTFTITFDGQTTAPLPWNATAAQVQAALEALSNIAPGDVTVTGGPANTANVTVTFTGALATTGVPEMTTNAAALTTAPLAYPATTAEGDWFNAPFVDARRGALNTNDLRGKVLRITVAANGSYTVPSGNLFAPGTARRRGPRSTPWASGTRSGSRWTRTTSRTSPTTRRTPTRRRT